MLKFTRSRKKKRAGPIEWQEADDIKARIDHLLDSLDIGFEKTQILTKRSVNANTRAYARIWGLGRIWQEALNLKPTYVIEVISEKFDKLPHHQQDEILLHEIAHIPNNFSGSLMPHKRRGKGNFHDKLETMISAYKKRL